MTNKRIPEWSREVTANLPPPFELPSERLPDNQLVYRLTEGGKLIGRWRDVDVPWLRDWMRSHLVQLYGFATVAQGEVKALPGKRKGGRARRANTKDALIREKAASLLEKGFEPLRNVPEIAAYVAKKHRSGECSERWVRLTLQGSKISRK